MPPLVARRVLEMGRSRWRGAGQGTSEEGGGERAEELGGGREQSR
jgi:hypothetical protein